MTRRVVAALGAALALAAGVGPAVWASQLHDEPTSEYQELAPAYPDYFEPVDDPLSGVDDPRVTRRSGENVLPYVERVTLAVSAATYHCNVTNADQTWETALLSRASGGAFPGNQGVVDVDSYRCGFCSQTAMVLAQILRVNGIGSADAYGLEGHVVTTFTHDGSEWTTDADVGAGPLRVDWSDPEQLRASVADAYGDARMHWSLAQMQRVYADSGDDIGRYERVLPQWVGTSMEGLAAKQSRFVSGVATTRWAVVGLGVVLLAFGLRRPGREVAPSVREDTASEAVPVGAQS